MWGFLFFRSNSLIIYLCLRISVQHIYKPVENKYHWVPRHSTQSQHKAGLPSRLNILEQGGGNSSQPHCSEHGGLRVCLANEDNLSHIYSSGLRAAGQEVERRLSCTCLSLWLTPGFRVAVISFPRQKWHKLLRAVGHSALGPLHWSAVLSARHSTTH